MRKFLGEMFHFQPLLGSKSFRERLLSNELLSNDLLHFLLLLILVANAFGLLFPVLGSNDSYFYSVIAKHIITNGDWINLTFAGTDWLDKPHLPFWLTAISYAIFGINTFAYILPGFIFNLIGAYYTYRLAKHLYTHQVGLLSAIFYLSSIHLLLSSVDVRAEAFLLGEIMPACYYWLLYNEELAKIKFSCLLKGAVFTALALMTKGVFVLLIISSGLITLWFYNNQLKNFINWKWLLALILSLLLAAPEFASLYLQFDLHPEKIIFGHTHVSGIKFFFWDSQFGRFFDIGPITSGKNATIGHYFFFVHTFLWAFLPWTVFFIIAIWNMIKSFWIDVRILKIKEHDYNNLYLVGSFLPTFILFSLTKFQLDHYTNILIPFAAIICANWVCNKATRFSTHVVFYVQTGIALLLVIVVTVLTLLLFNGLLFAVSLGLCVLTLCAFAGFSNNRYLNKAIVYPVIAISLVFVFLMLINGRVYPRYDAGYNIAKYLNEQTKLTLVDYQINSSSLEFHSTDRYVRVADPAVLTKIKKPYYLVVNASSWPGLKPSLSGAVILDKFIWIRQEKFIPTLFNLKKRKAAIINLFVVFVPVAAITPALKTRPKSKPHKAPKLHKLKAKALPVPVVNSPAPIVNDDANDDESGDA